MRSTLTELVHVFMQLPFWVFLGLVAAAIWAWRSPRGTRRHRWRHAWAIGAVAFYAVSMPIFHASLESWLEHLHPVPQVGAADRADDNVILVLTAGWLRRTPTGYQQKMGESGWERTAAAVALWRRIGGRILFTGAPTPDGRDSAAAAMARLARDMGVPDASLMVEPQSLNTRENLAYSRRLLGERHGRVWLVTSALHMPRSVQAARSAGLAVTAYPCDYRADEGFDWRMLVPGNGTHPALERALHEIVGMAAYRLRGAS